MRWLSYAIVNLKFAPLTTTILSGTHGTQGQNFPSEHFSGFTKLQLGCKGNRLFLKFDNYGFTRRLAREILRTVSSLLVLVLYANKSVCTPVRGQKS